MIFSVENVYTQNIIDEMKQFDFEHRNLRIQIKLEALELGFPFKETISLYPFSLVYFYVVQIIYITPIILLPHFCIIIKSN